jgi:two-component system, OmpR family, sensor kinase
MPHRSKPNTADGRAFGADHPQLVDRYSEAVFALTRAPLAERARLNMMMKSEREPGSEVRPTGGVVPHALALSRSPLARQVAELIQAVWARDAFIAIAAHELRNPMTPMLGYVEHILSVARRPESKCPATIIAGLERLASQIAEYVKRATTLLDVSRITAGKLRVELSLVDLSAVILRAVQRHRVGAERSGCRLELSIDRQISGLLDELAVEQIADNLLSNAIKYGTGEPIDVSLVNDGAKARLTVRDHGIGISKEDQARIFDAFERAVTRREEGGFGIGLWVVRHLVDAMRGEIHVTSRPAEGSTFTVDLPLLPP